MFVHGRGPSSWGKDKHISMAVKVINSQVHPKLLPGFISSPQFEGGRGTDARISIKRVMLRPNKYCTVFASISGSSLQLCQLFYEPSLRICRGRSDLRPAPRENRTESTFHRLPRSRGHFAILARLYCLVGWNWDLGASQNDGATLRYVYGGLCKLLPMFSRAVHELFIYCCWTACVLFVNCSPVVIEGLRTVH